jgi:hypothetical protein
MLQFAFDALVALFPTSLGQKTKANSLAVTVASDQDVLATSTKQTDGTQKAQTVDGSGNVQPAGDTAARPIWAKLSDGAAALFDAAARAGWVKVTDGTNSMPTADAAGRALFTKTTDGTNTAAVKAASTAAGATDPSLVVQSSPNDPNVAGLTGKFPSAATPSDSDTLTSVSRIAALVRGYDETNVKMLRTDLANIASAVLTPKGVLQVFNAIRYVATRPTLTDGQLTHGMANTRGDTCVAEQYGPVAEDNTNGVIHTHPAAIASSASGWTPYASGTTKIGSAGVSLKVVAGRLRALKGINTHASTAYYLVAVNKSSAPTGNEASVWSTLLPANGAESQPMDFGAAGKVFTAGVAFAISTVPEKVTFPATSDCIVWGDYV